MKKMMKNDKEEQAETATWVNICSWPVQSYWNSMQYYLSVTN